MHENQYYYSQAIDCFLRSSVDFLAIGGYICDHKWREIALKGNKWY